MTDVLGVLAYLLIPLTGIGVWRLEFVRRMPIAARIAIATAAGSLVVALVMATASLLHIEWSRGVLVTVFVVIAAVSVRLRPSPGLRPPSPRRGGERGHDVGTVILWLLTLYGTLTARESCGDLQFTWGPKAIRFVRAGGIDPNVLHTWPQLTVDYPPLQTLLLAWSNTLSGHFSWWSAVLAAPLFFLATLAVIRTWSRDALGTLLVAAALAWGFALAYPAGCAEPPLLLFETIAIAALTFENNPKAQTFFAALGAAGAVWTKLEGTTFAIAVVVTILVVQRNVKRALIVAAPAAILIGSWLTFIHANGLMYMYRGAKMPIYFETLPVVLRTLAKVARFDLLWLPWIIAIVVIALGNIRRALVPIAIALLTACATVFFYIHYPDPVWWIESSSPRVILTPLLALLIGAVAASDKVRAHGVVPQGKETEGSGREADRDPGRPLGQV